MTNNEAVEILEDFLADNFISEFETEKEALHMAISALKSNPKPKKWIKKISGDGWNDWYVYICPYCGQVHEKITYTYAYCPNCGTYLKGDTNE